MRRVSILVAMLIVALLATAGVASAATTHVSGSGSDSNPCTEARPCRTIPTGASTAGTGGTVVVHNGTYAAGSSPTSIHTPGLHILGASGESPVLTGEWQARGADQEWAYLKFDATASTDLGNFDIRAHRIDWHHNEATGGKYGACVLVGTIKSEGSKVHDSWVHDCGSTERGRRNQDHCVYATNPINFEVYNVLIERCIARGVQLYPAGSGARVYNNTVIDAGRNGLLNNGNANAVFENNIIVNAGRKADPDPYDDPNRYAVRFLNTGVVRNNVFWRNVYDAVTGTATVANNLVADPRFVDNFHIASDSPAIGWAFPSSSPLTDFDGQLRDAMPDAGADEYVASATDADADR